MLDILIIKMSELNNIYKYYHKHEFSKTISTIPKILQTILGNE